MQVKALTYNVWNIPVAQHTKKRMDGIAKILEENKDNVDIVGLLECWKEKDRNQLIAAAKRGGLPYSIFFRSGRGFPGGDSSGLVVMSRWPIENSFYSRFSVAGKPQKVLHWDYAMFSGKGVGLAQIKGPPEIGNIDYYISHFVAYYTPKPGDPEHDEYVFHRRLGAWEASRFIHSTARKDSLVICGVDLNANSSSLTYRSLVHLGQLCDAWKIGGRARKGVLPDALSNAEEKGLTVNYAGNCYFENNAWIASGEPSERIDYILFRAPETITLEWCERRYTGCDDTESVVSLSDHAGVLACFGVSGSGQTGSTATSETPSKQSSAPNPSEEPKATVAILDELANSALAGIEDARCRRHSACLKLRVFAAVALVSWILPHFGAELFGPMSVAAFCVVSILFALASFAFAVVSYVSISDEESGMIFMLDCVNLQRQYYASLWE